MNLYFTSDNSLIHTDSLPSRHRLSEADEDEELLEAEDDDLESTTITMFTDSPYCECTVHGCS